MPTFQLGSIVYSGATAPSSLDIGGSASYAEHALLVGKPMIQRVGSGLDSLTMSLRLHQGHTIPEDRIAELETAMQSGEVMPLLTGAGDVLGEFVVTDVTKTMLALAPDGSIIECTVSVTLLEYSTPDRASRRKNAARRQAFALEENDPVPSAPGATQQVERLASEETTVIATSAAVLDDSTSKGIDIPAREQLERRKMEISLRQIVAAATRARTLCDGFSGDLFTNTRDLDSTLGTLVVQAEGVLGPLLQGQDLLSLRTTVDTLLTKVGEVKSTAAYLTAYTTARK
jgi:phage protein U